MFQLLKNSTAREFTQAHTTRTTPRSTKETGVRAGLSPPDRTPPPTPPRQVPAAREAAAPDTASGSPHLPPRATPHGVWAPFSISTQRSAKKSRAPGQHCTAEDTRRFLPARASSGRAGAGTGTPSPLPTCGTRPTCPGTAGAAGPRPFSLSARGSGISAAPRSGPGAQARRPQAPLPWEALAV